MKYYTIKLAVVALIALTTSCIVKTEEDKKNIEKEFLEAAHKGNLKKVNDCLNNGAQITTTDDDGNTALHLASDEQIIQRLLEGQKEVGWLYNSMTTIDLNAKNKNGDTPLYIASLHGREKIVTLLLNGHKESGWLVDAVKKATINVHNNNNNTPLHMSALNGHESITQQLLVGKTENGWIYSWLDKGEANAENNNGDTPAHMAAMNGNTTTLAMLIRNSADIEKINKKNQKPIEIAAYKHKNNAVVFLQQQGAEYIPQDGTRPSILHIAFETDNTELAKLFAINKTLLNNRDEKGLTPLALAIHQQKVSFIEMALANGANPNIADFKGVSPLHKAIHAKNHTITNLLIQSKANVNAQDQHGKTPLHYAADTHSINLLLSHHASLDAPDNNGNTSLHINACNGDKKICQHLMKHGADPKKENRAGQNAFSIIMDQKNNNDLLDLVLSHKDFDINAIDKNGQTALMRAANNADIEKVAYYLHLKANPLITDIYGNTALHTTSSIEVAKKLLAANKQALTITNTNNQMPLVTALKNKRESLAVYFIEQGAPITIVDKNNNTLLDEALHNNLFQAAEHLVTPTIIAYHNNNGGLTLHTALQKHANQVVHKMILAGAALHMPDIYGNKPLHAAAYANNTDGAQRLLTHRADPNSRNNKGETALMIAAQKNKQSFIDLLLKYIRHIDLQDNKGFTAFTHATAQNNFTIMHILYHYGASPTHRDSKGNTPYHVAAEAGNIGALECLADLKISSDSRNDNNETPFMVAIKADKLTSLQFFLCSIAYIPSNELDKAITYATRHQSYNIKRHLQSIKDERIDECNRIIHLQNKSNQCAQDNKKLYEQIKAKTAHASVDYSISRYTLNSQNDLLQLDADARKEKERLFKEYYSHEYNEKRKLENYLQEIQEAQEKTKKECSHIMNIQYTVKQLRQNNEQLNKAIQAKTLSDKTVTPYNPTTHPLTHTEEALAQLGSSPRNTVLRALMQCQAHEGSEKTRLTQKLKELDAQNTSDNVVQKNVVASENDEPCFVCYGEQTIPMPCNCKTMRTCESCLNELKKKYGTTCPTCHGKLSR